MNIISWDIREGYVGFLISSKREIASIGFDRGDVEKDEEGIRTMRVLGENMAWVMKRLCG